MTNLLKKLGRGLAIFAVFVVLLTAISKLTTYFTAERYFEGAVPSRIFPVIKATGSTPPYELLRWHQVKAAATEAAQPFKLTENEGRFTVPDRSDYEPEVHFRTGAAETGRQRIEISVYEDDYTIHAAYETDGSIVRPEYLRVWGPSSVLLAVFPAFVLTLIFARVWRRRRERTEAAAVSA